MTATRTDTGRRGRSPAALAMLAGGGLAVATLLGGCATPPRQAASRPDALGLIREFQAAARTGHNNTDLSIAGFCRTLLEFGYRADMLVVRFRDPASGRLFYRNLVRWQEQGGHVLLDPYTGQTYGGLPQGWELIETVAGGRLYSDPRFADRHMSVGVAPAARIRGPYYAGNAR